MERGERVPWTVNKYQCGNWIYQNVLRIRFVIRKCDLTKDPYGLIISIFFFFTGNQCQIAESSPSCLAKQELISHV